MGRAPCCDKANVKKGPWSPEEDARLKDYMDKNGFSGNWIALPQKAGLKRCGKSCRLRWLNYLRPNIKHGGFSDHEDRIICTLYASIGSRWSIIAAQLPGRTDNDIKNYWNTKLKKKLMGMMIPFPFDENKIQSLPLLSSTLSQIYRDSSSSHYTTSSSKSLSHQQNLLYNNMSINYPLTTTNHSYYNQMNPPIMHFHPSGSSSSDGSCCQTQTQTQISHVKAEIKQEQMNYEIHQSFMSNNFYDQETHKLLMDCNNSGDQISTWADQKPNIFSTNSQLFSDLEEVKQLVNSSSLFLNDENKMHERDMYYY